MGDPTGEEREPRQLRPAPTKPATSPPGVRSKAKVPSFPEAVMNALLCVLVLQDMRDHLEESTRLGIEAIND